MDGLRRFVDMKGTLFWTRFWTLRMERRLDPLVVAFLFIYIKSS
jgi:hypothetical protein